MKKGPIIAIVIGVAVVIGLFNINTNHGKQPEVDNDTTTLPQSVPGHYVSQKLGVAFYYEASTTEVSEEGNKIYVGGIDGQSVEVFAKDPAASLEEAIKSRFIAGKDPKKCYVTIDDGNPDRAEFRAVIDYPVDESSNEPFWAQGDCGEYSRTNGMQYFYYDARYPDRYYFFRIGQYAILSGRGHLETWQDTFKIFK